VADKPWPRPPSDFEGTPLGRRVLEIARDMHASRRRVVVAQVVAWVEAEGYRTSERSVARWLRQKDPGLFGVPPYERR